MSDNIRVIGTRNPWYPYAYGEPPPPVRADRERRRGLDQDTIVGRLAGDPLPGRSALDRKRAGIVEPTPTKRVVTLARWVTRGR